MRKEDVAEAEARFWPKVAKAGPDECWLWTGAHHERGYGFIGVGGATRRAHRVSWFLANGSEPNGGVLHRCDNPPCVNPAHLFVGTQRDNMLDAADKGRWARPDKRCARGHLVEGDNAYKVPKQRYYACRECKRIQWTKQNAKRKATKDAARGN